MRSPAVRAIAINIVADPWRGMAAALTLLVLVAIVDFVTGYEVRLSILYLLPIAIGTWSAGARAGVMLSLLAVACWGFSFLPDHVYARDILYAWEGLVLAATFNIFVWLLIRLKLSLTRAELRFRDVLEGLSAYIYVVGDRSGRVLYANRRFAGMMRAEPVGINAADIEQRLEAAAGGLPAQAADASSAFTYHEARDRFTGAWFLVQTGPIRWEGRTRAHLHVLIDITEQKAVQSLRQQQREILHKTARFAVLAEISSMLGHEINQPLMAIATYSAAAKMLLAQPRPDIAEATAALEKSRLQAVRASEIVARTRSFLQRRKPSVAECHINQVIDDALLAMEPVVSDMSVHLRASLEDGLPVLPFDRTLIEQVLTNLLGNAVDAVRMNAEHRADPGRVEIAAARHGDHGIRVSVRDNGAGIPPAVAAKLFTPFFTTKEQGLGLGLCICRSIVEAHGGQMWHESPAGAGTVFHFTLGSVDDHSEESDE
ncbi:sensor histidine kinase [Noviherbaspirillum humi]|nr:ATP-binding protein [Noviherbaspirillum humi]